ncbi:MULTISPECIES: class I SAM-dependent methyltransferase [Micromonospora]|uniref:Class I SAM-dependent methyltransferase n=1 Tax=Micromonospora solifontis TaxID=2487138 RepID=A0ABX9WG94_9ACTN|nr:MULTISPECIES: class I SAM-dependent methyltransferase [Micromonospora]NES15537.1 class I SAM-dependent methyltransferase [Micromonospora sp. PPF5-17B]NES36893.1 class I SAM-dependent methyltransferase [Micromonospora solifontis]NES55236.1 class I SAM-dependent methyltransferase [Micromonospora sp. PPF5-6]RNL98943.1 class I SAM-dependent methyltransferase [Micromonospora solifontis]
MTTDTAAGDRISLPGGEMLAWSDLRTGGPAGGGPLAVLAARVVPAGARVLLAGPHEPAFLDRLAHAEVTCLLRSHLDGVALADRAADRAVRVIVGGPAGLPAGEAYDVVIAGSGLDPVESVEGARLGWDGVLATLAGALRPGGTLLLRLDNPVGLHRIVDASPWYADRDDAAWTIDGVLHAGHPANLDQLRGRLTDAGLTPDASFAGYPHPAAVTALVATGELDRATSAGLFDAVLHGACTGGYADRPVLQDPARLAVDTLHAGLGNALAPAWVVLARRDTATGADRADLPVVLARTGPPEVGVMEVVATTHGWHWRVTDPPARSGPAAGPCASRLAAYRDAGALTGPVPTGRLLRTLLLDACLRRDLDTLRTLLAGYAGWLESSAVDGRVAGAPALAGVDNVVVAGDRFAVLDPSWRAAEPLPVDVALARGLWRFAAVLLTGGYAHPWSSTLDLAGLTVVLGGMAGRELDRTTVAAAVEIEAAVVAALRGLDAKGRLKLADELSALEPTSPPPGPESWQQLREAWLRQREELGRVRAVLGWTEDLLTSRERALRRADAMINLLNGSVSYRVGRLVITPARWARRAARAAKRRLRAALRRRVVREEQQ